MFKSVRNDPQGSWNKVHIWVTEGSGLVLCLILTYPWLSMDDCSRASVTLHSSFADFELALSNEGQADELLS